MTFLYRFELLEYDAALQDVDGLVAQGVVTPSAGIGRTVYRHTNSELAVAFPVDPLGMPFLPSFSEAGGVTYTPALIQHDGLRLDSEEQSGTLSVTLNRDHPVSQLYAYDAPGAHVWLTVALLDGVDPAPKIVWTGRVSSADFGEQMCVLKCSPVQDVLKRAGLTKRYPRTCGHQLFDAESCGLNRNAYDHATGYFKYREDGFVSARSADGYILTVPAAANRPVGFFNDGLAVIGGTYGIPTGGGPIEHYPRGPGLTPSLQFAKLNGGVRRSIVSHSGTELELLLSLPPTGVAVGDRVTLFRGCNRTRQMCTTDFSNIRRHGGYPFIPIKNLFEVGVKDDE